jgi:uncharacterized protein YlxW (UPF0749 family)
VEETVVTRRRLLPSVAVGGVFAIFGLLLATGADAAPDVRGARSAELVDVVAQAQRDVADLDAEAAGLRSDLEADSSTAAQSDAQLRQERAVGDGLAPAAGLTPVTGTAVRVELNDAPPPPPGEPLPPGVTYDDLVVHQQDVQSVVNALWTSGATAMTVMDQRIITTSAVRCVGNTLILDGRVYSPPYQIVAVGDVPSMRRALDTDPAVGIYREWAEVVGLGFSINDDGEVELPGYDGPLQLQWAEATT